MTSFTFFLIIASLIVILILREVATWYWKVNQIVTYLRSIEELLFLNLDLNKNIEIKYKKNEKLRTVTIKKYLEMPSAVKDNHKIENTNK
jgi:hypothetical protein